MQVIITLYLSGVISGFFTASEEESFLPALEYRRKYKNRMIHAEEFLYIYTLSLLSAIRFYIYT